MPRELFVEKRLVRRQQIDDAAILFQLSVEEQLHLLDERDPQVVVEPGKLLVEIRREQPDISRLQPLLEEVLHQRGACTLVAQHAADLSIEHRRLVQLSTDRRVEQFVIGNAAPQEKRQARRQLDIGQGVGGAGGGAGRIASQSGTGNPGSREPARFPHECPRRNLPARARPDRSRRASECRRWSGATAIGAPRERPTEIFVAQAVSVPHALAPLRRARRRTAAAGRASPVIRGRRTARQ